MKKKLPGKKIKAKTLKKGYIKHYLRIYFVCQGLAIAIFSAALLLGGSFRDCANSRTCKSDLSESIDNDSVGYFQGRKIIPPKIDLAESNVNPAVLGTNVPSEDKHIYVDLSAQKLYAYDGTREFMQTLVATGRWGKTPVGNFHIWTKLRATRMSGGSGADYYNLPNVPSVMYFYNDFGIHGAYWHNNFGHTMSHGCVNMRIAEAKTLFDWADGPGGGKPGTAVSICDKFTAPDHCEQENPVN